MKPGKKADEAIPVIEEELARARKELVSADELDKAKNEYESGYFYRLMSVGGFGGRADLLNEYAYYAGDPGYLDKDLQRYREATATGISSWAQKTLGPKCDLKQFHEILREGAMPLSILERRIRERTAAIA